MAEVPENKNKYNISDNLTGGNSADIFSQQKGNFQHEERRNYKDSVFVDLFYTDQNAGENLLSLSDAYQEKNDSGTYALELEVRMININQKAGHPVLEKCPVLKEYSEFVEHVRAYGNDEQKLTKAVIECIREGILSEYLERKSREVINMLIGEYDYEMDMQEKQEEIREELQEVIAKAKAEKAAAEKAAAEAKAEKAAAERAAAERAAAEKTKQLLGSLVQKGLLSAKDAAAEMGVSEETFLKWIE